jgi:hypothetical protein
MKCIVVFGCSVVVASFCRATDKVSLHNVSLVYTCVESAHRVEGGASGQHVAHVMSLPHKPSHGTYCVREARLIVTSLREVGVVSTTIQHDNLVNTIRCSHPALSFSLLGYPW